MERTEQTGLAVALIGHVVVFGLLSAQFLAHPPAMKPPETPLEVSLVEDVAPVAQAPAAPEPPAQSRAPDAGPPADAPPPDVAPTPETAAPAPAPSPPPAPVPKPTPVPKSVPTPKATPQPKKPMPVAKPSPKAPVVDVSTPSPKAVTKPQPKAPAAPAKAVSAKATTSGSKPTATKARPTGSRLDAIFKNGLTETPSKSSTPAPPKAAVIDAKALAGIQDAIARQIQPCADRQVNPGPGANQIVTVLNLRLNRDGTLAAIPTVVRQSGVDGDNDRYGRRVIDLGVAAFKGCAPLKLPPEYYATPNGGWNNINYNWQLR
ncbi:MAG: cell envelope biogenesis protein TolA [Sphingomonas sp.]